MAACLSRTGSPESRWPPLTGRPPQLRGLRRQSGDNIDSWVLAMRRASAQWQHRAPDGALTRPWLRRDPGACNIRSRADPLSSPSYLQRKSMAIIQANVPQNHLATAMGAPNELLVEYSTDVLLPVAGPYYLTKIRRSFYRALMYLNDFLSFVEDLQRFLAAGGNLQLPQTAGDVVFAGMRSNPDVMRELALSARLSLNAGGVAAAAAAAGAASPGPGLRAVPPSRDGRRTIPPERSAERLSESLLRRLASPNTVFADMYDARLLRRNAPLLAPTLANAANFNARALVVLTQLLQTHAAHAPAQVKATMRALGTQAMAAANRQPTYMRREFEGLPAATRALLFRWMVAFFESITPPAAGPFAEDLTPTLGFGAASFTREWAMNRRERLSVAFGTPDLRGPVVAEPLPPQGRFAREDYTASQNELTHLVAESRFTRNTEAVGLSAASLRRELDSVYYSGPGAVNQLTGQAGNALMTEDRRQIVLSMIREVSETRERAGVDFAAATASTTVKREAVGVDQRLAATHHRFRVVVPVTSTVQMYDVGLTWCPRVFNPFFALRKAIRSAYTSAYRSHIRQYYVPEPVRPGETFERYTVTTSVNIEKENKAVVMKNFSIALADTSRNDHPDLNGVSVTWHQSESIFNDEPDHYTASAQDLGYSGGLISGTIRLETDDGGSDWQGFAEVNVPVLRYTQETVNALAQYELQLNDYALKRQALEAQAKQFAHIKEREFVERHEAREPRLKIVIHELLTRITDPSLGPDVSYYEEIIRHCIDWTHAKMEFEPVAMDLLAYPDFEADHFVNSIWVRLFLPVNNNAEQVFFDALTACGTFQTRASVTQALTQVNATRQRLQANGPDLIDTFTTQMVIGDHIEAVMSHRELGT